MSSLLSPPLSPESDASSESDIISYFAPRPHLASRPSLHRNPSSTSSYYRRSPSPTVLSLTRFAKIQASLHAERFSSSRALHCLVLSYTPSPGNLQVEGALTHDLESDDPHSSGLSSAFSKVFYSDVTGDSEYWCYLFESGRFRFEASPEGDGKK